MERTLDNTVNTVLESIFGKNGLQINMIFGFIILVVGIGMFLFSKTTRLPKANNWMDLHWIRLLRNYQWYHSVIVIIILSYFQFSKRYPRQKNKS